MKEFRYAVGLLYLMILAFGCSKSSDKNEAAENTSDLEKPAGIKINDTIPKVTGIGGIFFRAKDPEAIRAWYGRNLGLAIDDYGSPFEFRNARHPEQRNYLRWSPFKEKTGYFDPSGKQFMINYRVQNIEGLIRKLSNNGVSIVDSITAYDYGKFIHIMDPEGNKIELWEPVDSVFTKMGRPTTK
jgi:predicted enzyme related to lactoylglutathione lyase